MWRPSVSIVRAAGNHGESDVAFDSGSGLFLGLYIHSLLGSRYEYYVVDVFNA